MTITKHVWKAVGLAVLVGGCTIKSADEKGTAGVGNTPAAGGTGNDSAGAAGADNAGAAGEGTPGTAGTPSAAGSSSTAGTAGQASAATQSGRPAGLGRAEAGAAGAGTDATATNIDDGPTEDMRAAAARAIQEADIIQFRGDYLYAMSRVAGLSVVDISVQDQLTLVGTFRHESTPFEMYLRGDVVVAIYRGAQRYDSEGYSAGTTSEVVALDVTNPARIQELSSFDMPGDVSDSRAIGDVLYVVSHQNDCYNCEDTPSSTVVSFDISDATAMTEVDRLALPEAEGSWGVSRRSVMATDTRLYLAGVASEQASTIDAVDISDSTGVLQLAGSVTVNGAIFSRWQMDERLNVLRVISQPPLWDLSEAPVVQTFTIKDCATETCTGNDDLEFEPLGELTMVLPQPEQLRSVRFDDNAAYAVTFERQDPLFTIDLTDPSSPVQTGELTMPGWIYHMEPRGDRILALGFDTSNEEGSLFVSLIDVSDMSAPTELQRRAFGGDWAEVGEDQERVHKLFNVMDDLGLILVPYYGSQSSCGGYGGGIQLFEFTADTLTKRGLAASDGQVRRAFINNDRLFAVSEQQIQSFNIDDYSAPSAPTTLELINRVYRTVPVGEKLLRIQSNWWTRVPYVDLVPLSEAASPRADSNLNLYQAIVGVAEPEYCYYYDDIPFQKSPAFVFGNYVAIVAEHSDANYNRVTSIVVLDASGDAPVVAGRLVLQEQLNPAELGAAVIQIGESLVLQVAGTKNANDEAITTLRLVDMSDPTTPEVVESLDRPRAWGTTGLHLEDGVLFSGYYNATDGDDVSYFLDRVTGSDLTEAEPAKTIPGLLVGPMGEQLLSVDFDWSEATGLDYSGCYSQNGTYDDASQTCWIPERRFQLVDIDADAGVSVDSADIDNSLRLAAVLRGDSIFFLPAVTTSNTERILTVASSNNQLVTGTSNLIFQPISPTAIGKRLYFLHGGELAMLDAAEDVSPIRQHVAPLEADRGYHLAMTDTLAIASLGDFGAQVITLAQ